MRRSLPILALLTASPLLSQPIEVTDQRTESVIYPGLVPIADGRWLVPAQVLHGSGNRAVLIARNSDGSIAWERTILDNTGHSRAAAAAPDSGFLAAGFTGCDVVPAPSVIERYDANGDTLWRRWVSFSQDDFDALTGFARGGWDRIAAIGFSTAVLFNMSGDSLRAWPLPATRPRAMHWSGDSLLYMIAANALYRVDTMGLTRHSVVLDTVGVDIRVRDGRVLVLTPDSLLHFDPFLDRVAGFALGAGSGRAFVDGDDGLYLRTDQAVHAVQPTGEPALLFALSPLPAYTISGAAVRDGMAMASGNTDITGRSTAVMRNHTMAGAVAHHDTDVEILMSVDSVWFELDRISPVDTFCYQYANITARLVNKGIGTLDKAVVSFRYPDAISYCAFPALTVPLDSMGLLPGDTLDVPLPRLGIGYGPARSGATVTTTLCVVALAPNGQVDREPSDNTACRTVTYRNTVGITERSKMPGPRLYPVPFADHLTIAWPGAITGTADLELFDTAGRPVLRERIAATGNGRTTLGTAALASGLYLLRATSDGQHWTLPVVKE